MKLADLHPFSARLDLFTASTAEQLLSTADAHPQMIVKMSHSNTQEPCLLHQTDLRSVHHGLTELLKVLGQKLEGIIPLVR